MTRGWLLQVRAGLRGGTLQWDIRNTSLQVFTHLGQVVPLRGHYFLVAEPPLSQIIPRSHCHGFPVLGDRIETLAQLPGKFLPRYNLVFAEVCATMNAMGFPRLEGREGEKRWGDSSTIPGNRGTNFTQQRMVMGERKGVHVYCNLLWNLLCLRQPFWWTWQEQA